MLDPQELADLKTRCIQAMTLGFEIARAEHYAALLGAKPGDVTDVAKNSPAHLLELIAKAEGKSEAPKAKKKAEKVEEEEPGAVELSETLSATASVEAPVEPQPEVSKDVPADPPKKEKGKKSLF